MVGFVGQWGGRLKLLKICKAQRLYKKKYKLGTIRNIKGKPRLTLQFAAILNLNTLWMIYLQNACIMYVMQWHTNVWNSLDIDLVYIQHNKCIKCPPSPHQLFHQTPSEGSQQAKVLAKVLAANRDPWKPNLPMGQIPKNWNITDSAGCINPR